MPPLDRSVVADFEQVQGAIATIDTPRSGSRQCFHFLDLPAEIRLMIYRLVLTTSWLIPFGLWVKRMNSVWPLQERLALELLRVNRQIYHEGKNVLLRSNSYCFAFPEDVSEMASIINRKAHQKLPFSSLSICNLTPMSDWKVLTHKLIDAPQLRNITVHQVDLFPKNIPATLRAFFGRTGKPNVTLDFLLSKSTTQTDCSWGRIFFDHIRCDWEESRNELTEASKQCIASHYHQQVTRWYSERKFLPKDFLSDRRFENLWEKHKLVQARTAGQTL